MSKTISANLKAEIESGAPSIATCWKIQRVDGTVLGFTDWPDPFLYSGTTYNSIGGYQRTAMDQREGLSVDNMDIVGVIDSTYITEDDLTRGLYRGAKLWVFMLSPNNLGWGDMDLDYGYLGEVHMGKAHFVAEFRSLVTLASQTFGNKFSRYCRHTLGESSIVGGIEMKCGIVLQPSDWAATTAYAVGDAVMPVTKNGRRYVCTVAGTSAAASFGYDFSVGLKSPLAYWRLGESAGATAADETTNFDGTYNNTPTLGVTGLLASDADTAVDFDEAQNETVSADYAGLDNLFDGGGSVSFLFNPDTGFTTPQRLVSKDAGTGVATDNYRGWAVTWDPSDGSINFFQRFSDGSTAVSGGGWKTDSSSISAGTTYHVVVTYNNGDVANNPIIYINGSPVNVTQTSTPTASHTRSNDADAVLYIGNCDTSQGHPSRPFDGTMDDVALFSDIIGAGEAYELWDIANNGPRTEPIWPLTIGGTITEGTVTWKAYDAYMKWGSVTGVTSRFKFTDSALTDAADNFKYGVIEWLTGSNAGIKQDVKSSTALGVVELRRAAPYDIQTGDTFKVSVGCNHILKMPTDVVGSPYTGHCRAKFNLENGGNAANYGGEPEMPNMDRISAPASSV